MRTMILAIGATALLGAPSAHADVYEVMLMGHHFMYNGQENLDIELTIQPGDTVRWVWVTGIHNVVSGMPGDKDAGSEFFSGPPGVGLVFEHTFMDPGEYFYFCEVHAPLGMVSFLTVAGGCEADINGDGALNILDFIAFQTLFSNQDPGADCDGNGLFNILDFICFQTLFQQGCP